MASTRLIFLFLTVWISSIYAGQLESRTGQVCLNDGFLNNTNCFCKNPNYITGTSCKEFHCVNYGRLVQRTQDFDTVSWGCDCPRGFRGLHCEPVACVQNDDNSIKAFYPVARTFSLLVTLNDFMRNLQNDDITSALVTLLSQQSFTNAIDTVNLLFPGGFGVANWPDPRFPDVSKWLAQSMKGVNSYNLTSQNLLDLINRASTNSPLLIITNVGLTDTDAVTMNRVLQVAVARQIDVSVIVASQYNSFQSVFFDPAFAPLIQLTEYTLGSFITPYPMIGPPVKDSASSIIPSYGNLISSKTVVSTAQLSSCRFNAYYFNLYGDATDEWEVYVSMYVKDISLSGFDPSVQSANPVADFVPVVNTGIWQLFKLPYDRSHNQYGVLIGSNFTLPCNYRVWTTSKKRLTTLPRTTLAYTTSDQSDATSALPVFGAANDVVAHLSNVPADMRQTLTVSFKDVLFSTFKNSTSRPCLFDQYFAPFTCGNAYYNTNMQITARGNSTFFQEVLPVMCVNLTDISQSVFNPEDSSRLDQKAADEFYDDIMEDDVPQCSPSTINLDPTNARTFALLFTNYKSLADVLLLSDQLLGQDTFGKVLSKYNSAYNFTKYFTMGYTTSSTDFGSFTNYGDFLTKVTTMIRAYAADPPTKNATKHVPALSEALDFLSDSFSDVIIMSTQEMAVGNDKIADLYKVIQEKRVKLHFIVFDSMNYGGLDYSGFYDLAARSAGSVIPTTDKAVIQQFFDLYGGTNRPISGLTFKNLGLSQTVFSTLNPSSFSFGPTFDTPNFMVVAGKSYYIMASVSNVASPTIRVNGIDTPFTMIGNNWGYVQLPADTTPGLTTVRIVTFTDTLLLSVFELTPPGIQEVVAFTTSSTVDADYAYPSFSGVGRLYPVVSANDGSAFITMLENDKQFNNGTLSDRNTTTCTYNQYFNYAWQCTSTSSVYYVQVDTADATRTSIFSCYSSGGSSTGDCQNGGISNGAGNCTCAAGFTGDSCSDIECYNGGTVTDANECDCTGTNYAGPHCENAVFPCQRQPATPEYASILETLILVVDKSTANGGKLIETLNAEIDKVANIYQQYILVTYYAVGGSQQIDVQIFNNRDYFVAYFHTLTDTVGYVDDVRIPLKKALSAVKTDRSLLIWLAGQTNICGESDRVDNELMQLVAKHRVEVRAFSTEVFTTTCFRSIATLGNGIVVGIKTATQIVDYINLLTPATLLAEDALPKHLVTFDSMNYQLCSPQTIAIPTVYQYDLIILTVSGFVYTAGVGTVVVDDAIYQFPTGATSVSLDCPSNSSAGYYFYSLEAMHDSRIAFTFGNSHSFIISGFSMLSDYDYSSFSFYVEDVDDTATDFSDIPVVMTSRISVDSSETFSYEKADTTRMSCSYPFMSQYTCNGEDGALRIKIIGKTTNDEAYQRVITGYCLSDIVCSVHGRKLKRGLCGCEPWWTGTDCSIPYCINGGTANKESCLCPMGFTGDNCENTFDPNRLISAINNRTVLILFDVFEPSNDFSIDDKKNLAISFLQSTKSSRRPQTNYLYATNDGNNATWLTSSDDMQPIIDKINSQQVINGTMDVKSALEFFDSQPFNIGPFTVSFIYYITHNALLPTDLVSDVVQSLKMKGVGVYSGFYFPNPVESPDINLLLPNSALGGITGSWTVYDIIMDFKKVLAFPTRSTPIVTPPPATTTPRPKQCVYDFVFDTVFFIDQNSDNSYQPSMSKFLGDFSNDINFDPKSTPPASRLSMGQVNMSVLQFCFMTTSLFQSKIGDLQFSSQPGPFQLSSYLPRINQFFTSLQQGARLEVPRILFLVTDKSNVDNTVIVSEWAKNMTASGITIALIPLGDADFSVYDPIISNGWNFPFNMDVDEFKYQTYKSLCQFIKTMPVGDVDASCDGNVTVFHRQDY